MNDFPVRDDEAKRLQALRTLNLIGEPATPDISAIVELASAIAGTPTALLNLVEEFEQHSLATVGTDLTCLPRKDAICSHTIFDNAPFVVPDLRADERFSSNVLVAPRDGLRFYAGVPLRSRDGLPFGTLCVVDTVPRTLSESAMAQLEELGIVASTLLRQHDQTRQLTALTRDLSGANAQLYERSQDLETTNKLLQEASRLGAMGAFEHDLRTDMVHWSDALLALHEIEGEAGNFQTSPEFRHLQKYYNKKDLARYLKAARRAQDMREPADLELNMRTAKGRRRWVRVRVDFHFEGDTAVRRFGIVQDVTEQKRLLTRLDYLANRDPLTGLHNRNHFMREGQSFLRRKGSTICGVAAIDLDGFKSINDTYGHGAGDVCLKAVTRRLRRVCGADMMLVRPGGDEFVVLFSNRMREHETVVFFERVRRALQEPIDWRGISFQVSGSIGIAMRHDVAKAQLDELMQEADLAVYKAKASGRNCVERYTSDLRKRAVDRFNALATARAALDNGDFLLFFQPKVLINGGKLAGFEALLRMRRPDGSIAPPSEFAVAFEDHVISRRIGDFVIDAAIAQAVQWRERGFDFGSIAINVSSSQFVGRSFVEPLIAKMEDAKLSPSDIQIEVTEGVLLSMDASSVGAGLKRLSQYGVCVAFDDFGTGYASLVHLRQLEFDIIKLDMSFVQSMTDSPTDMAIVQSVILLANQLGKKVVAEGVESETQADLLRAYGCHMAQGYLYSPPQPADLVLSAWQGKTAEKHSLNA